MSQKKPKPKSDQAPDLFDIWRQEQGNSQYMRYYLQQDHFTCHPLFTNEQTNSLIQQTNKPLLLKLFVNRVIFNAVSDVLINNKFVYNNSKIMNTTMESGRDMILGKYLKKHLNWQGYLNLKQFIMIKKAYESLSIQDQLRLQYSVQSISNLILKLGINISKLSCILVQRKYTTAFLSVPTLSVVFLQYLMFKFFESKQIDDKDQQAKSQFIRQLPRMTYIKLSEVINKAELMTLQIGQEVFFTSQTLKRVKNLQYLQFYQHQERDGIKEYQNITNYEYIKAINLREGLGMQSPFGFELLFLFRTVYFNVIKDFNPDVILFVEDYDSQHQIIQPQIRALLINQLMENVTGKVFVMREVGFRANFQYITSTNSLALQEYQKSKQKKPTQGEVMQVYGSQMQDQSCQQFIDHVELMQRINKQHDHSPNKKQQKTFLTSKQVQEMIMQRIQTLNLMTPQLQKKLDEQQALMMKKAQIQYNINVKNGVVSGDLCTMEQILRQDLSYIVLALIQQTPFEEVLSKSHKYMYSEEFLKRVVTCQYQLILDLKESFERKNELINKLQLSKQMVSSMVENVRLPVFTMYQDYYDSIYDLRQGKSYVLDIMGEENQIVERYRYHDNDYLKLHYGQNNQLLLFIFKTQNFTILKMMRFFNPIMNQEFHYWEPIVYEQQWLTHQTNPTYLVTNQFLYKAFGQAKSNNHSQNHQPTQSKILRANYRQLIKSNTNSRNKVSLKAKNPKMLTHQQMMDVEPQFPHLLKFEQLTQCGLEKGNAKTDIKLLNKSFGWAFYDEAFKNAIFMGGYSPTSGGQNTVNKYLHIVSEKQTLIRQTGKTTNQLFLGYKNYKSKIPLFPFIYGIPFIINKSCYILSTNGYFQNLTNNNKLYLTEFKLSQQPLDQKYGIINQHKLFVEYEKDQDRLLIITAKDFIVHYIVDSYGLMNCYQDKCILQTIEEGMLEIELKPNVNLGAKTTVALSVKTDRKDQHGFEEITLYFAPIQIV